MDSKTHAKLFLEELYHHTQNYKNGINEFCKTMNKRNHHQRPNKEYNGQVPLYSLGKIRTHIVVKAKNIKTEKSAKT